MHCSPSGLVFFVIANLIFNCLHFGYAAFVDGAAIADVAGISGGGDVDVGGDSEGYGVAGGRRLHIDITRKRSVYLNGVEIDEHALLDHLHEHERELILGKSKTRRPLKLVHLRQRTDADTDADNDVNSLPPAAESLTLNTSAPAAAVRRVKRADNGAPRSSGGAPPSRQEVVSVQIRDNEQLLNLQLRPTPKLIDDAFVFIRRYANSTQFIEDSHKLAAKYERCFYSNENSALDLCDDENVRGVFHHNSTDYIIHPLPARFGNTTHVILESNNGQLSEVPLQTTLLDENIQFEPDEEDFNEVNVMNLTALHTRNDNYSTINYHMPISNVDKHKSITPEAPNQHHHNHNNHHQQHHNHHYHHSGNNKSQTQIPLNLRYKPRYHHADQHQQQQQLHTLHQHHHHRNKQQKRQKHHQRKEKHIKTDFTPQPQKEDEEEESMQSETSATTNSRSRRHISSGGSQWPSAQVLHIETAIFVDSDLFKHMAKNFPHNTEHHLIRFVLAMINGVQLLYHHPSLGHRINFVLKRLEILYKDPKDLRRSSDIDTYLSNFCMWQKSQNPVSDADPLHFDHAVILTGLDLYVLGKNGKVISQVVGLAPVAGMCTPTSSCTINEGKHFESVFVVAHEIGHNLGMRHDTSENSCDPGSYIMSPTLGSGKTTWSDCSRSYLSAFLDKPLSKCLFDRGQFVNNLDHAAEGMLPGERFDANQQCMLKYGRESVRALNQPHMEICHDLHCQRGRYTWTSHPALEGTRCGENMWCRSGKCVIRPAAVESYSAPRPSLNAGKVGYDKTSYLESSKMGHLLHEYNYNKSPSWGKWGEAGDCASGCLFGDNKRLSEGSTGLRVYKRKCLDEQRRCLGSDSKYESCKAQQCYNSNVPITTIGDFATQVCGKAQKFDTELTGEGAQIIGDIEESCKVFCRTKTNGTKSRSWTFPDGTTCRSKRYKPEDNSYCIGGRCEKFSCDNSSQNYYKIDQVFCKQRQPPSSYNDVATRRVSSYTNNSVNKYPPSSTQRHNESTKEVTKNTGNPYSRNAGEIYGPTTYRNKYENEVAVRSFHGQERESPYKRKAEQYAGWHKQHNYPNAPYEERITTPAPTAAPPPTLLQHAPPPVSASLIAAEPPEWIVKSGCHSSCMARSKGVQVVTSRRTGANNIQLCTHTVKPCERVLTPSEHAEHTCARYKLKVRGLSGYGTQIAASVDEPDRSCRVGCQDEYIKYRFYLVNGKYGHFPLGTKCSNTEERYCVNGKCLEFGADNIPLQQSHISLALFRNRRSIAEEKATNATDVRAVNEVKPVPKRSRRKRSYLYYEPVNITETITQDFINSIVQSIIGNDQRSNGDEHMDEHIEFTNPIHISTDEEM